MISLIAVAGIYISQPYCPPVYADKDYLGPHEIAREDKWEDSCPIDRIGAPGDPVADDGSTGALGDPNQIPDFIGVE